MFLNRGALFIVLAILLCACGSNKNEGSPPITREIFVKGDPVEIVNGHALNSESFLYEEGLNRFNGFILYADIQFTQKEYVEYVSERDIETENEASDGTETFGSVEYRFTDNGTSEITFYPSRPNYPVLIFEKNHDGYKGTTQLTLKGMRNSLEGEFIPLSALHYSLKNGDRSAFSITAQRSQTDERGKGLLAFYFTKPSKQKKFGDATEKFTYFDAEFNKKSSDFNYLAGPGKRVRWAENKISIAICMKNNWYFDEDDDFALYTKEDYIKRARTEAEYAWDDATRDAGLNYSIEIKNESQCAPFTDLNEKTIHFVSDYRVEPSEQYANMGTTFAIMDVIGGEILAANILIWEKEFEKYKAVTYTHRVWTDILQRTINHELGHLLGLDHQFDENIKSLMSYDGTDYVTDYDHDALVELYKDESKESEEDQEDSDIAWWIGA